MRYVSKYTWFWIWVTLEKVSSLHRDEAELKSVSVVYVNISSKYSLFSLFWLSVIMDMCQNSSSSVTTCPSICHWNAETLPVDNKVSD